MSLLQSWLVHGETKFWLCRIEFSPAIRSRIFCFMVWDAVLSVHVMSHGVCPYLSTALVSKVGKLNRYNTMSRCPNLHVKWSGVWFIYNHKQMSIFIQWFHINFCRLVEGMLRAVVSLWCVGWKHTIKLMSLAVQPLKVHSLNQISADFSQLQLGMIHGKLEL